MLETDCKSESSITFSRNDEPLLLLFCGAVLDEPNDGLVDWFANLDEDRLLDEAVVGFCMAKEAEGAAAA
jgi:hypothetical protein